MSEKAIEARLVKGVKALGGLCVKIPAIFFKGIPDRMCLLPGGRIIFVEMKDTGKKPTDIQLHVHSKIRDLGFRVDVIDSNEGVDKFIADAK